MPRPDAATNALPAPIHAHQDAKGSDSAPFFGLAGPFGIADRSNGQQLRVAPTGFEYAAHDLGMRSVGYWPLLIIEGHAC
jgi:hypothetical protein